MSITQSYGPTGYVRIDRNVETQVACEGVCVMGRGKCCSVASDGVSGSLGEGGVAGEGVS